jgi:hypothetical protein
MKVNVTHKHMPNYNFPSSFINEIEAPLRRQKKEKSDVLFWIVLMGVLLGTILHFVVEPLLTPKAHAEEYSNKTEMCSHLTDPALNGTSAKQTLLTICN